MAKTWAYIKDKYGNLVDWIGKHPAISLWVWLALIAAALSV